MESEKPFVALIIQARMKSTRLPGKVLQKILGRPMLFYLLERVKRIKNADAVIVATTDDKSDDLIAGYCRSEGVLVFRGDEEDVLERYLLAARSVKADAIVRITGDCPLIDPEVVEKVIQFYLESDYDYVGNTLNLTYPRGMDTEVFSMKALETASQEAKKKSEREHVTLYMYQNPDKFKLANVPYYRDRSELRLTVDTKEDFELIKQIFEALYPVNPTFSLEDIIGLLQENPQMKNINRHVAQKIIKEI